jgi:RES domain-containing protein
MIVYRLSKTIHAKDLSGRGAERSGGRWNSKGIPMLYTSASRALYLVEIAVHIPLGMVPDDYSLVRIEIPDDTITELAGEDMPVGWQSFPHTNASRETGDQFVATGESLAMKVPSAVVQGDFNYLINPAHPRFSDVKILGVESFPFDRRLFGKG